MSYYLLSFHTAWKGNVADYANRAAWGLLVMNLIVNSLYFYYAPNANGFEHLTSVQSRIMSKLEADDTIIASQTYWFGLYEHNYYSWEQLVYYKKWFPDSSYQDIFCRFAPDILIRDDHLDQFITDEVSNNIYNGELNINQEELEGLLEKKAIILDDFHDSQFGHIRIYRLILKNDCSTPHRYFEGSGPPAL
jgi:hypothetical protein